MLKKIIVFIPIFSLVLSNYFLSHAEINAYEYAGEKIVYVLKPLGGRVEYNDLGMVEFQGRSVKLTTFKTEVLGFTDTEKIYSAPDTLLPIKVEREVRWFGKENIIEEYDQKNFTVTVTKLKGKKKIKEQILKGNGSIHNAILLAFYPRDIPNLDIGWSFDVRLPNKFEAKLVSIDNIKVAGRKFKAYHFTSIPNKFEIWINKDNPRIPLKIKGKGSFNYTLLMKEYSPGESK
jgi:hypothetical protein